GRASAWDPLTPFMNDAARGSNNAARGSNTLTVAVRLVLVLDLLELRLVVGLLVGLLARDEAPLHEVHEGGVHRLHADGAAALHGGFELVQAALADEIRDRRGVDEDLERRYAPRLVLGGQELLRDDAAKRRREHGTDVALLVGGEGIDDAVDSLCGTVRVQRAHDEDAHFRRGHGDGDGFEVAHFADEDDVRVFTQGGVKGGGERLAVHADLTLADQASLSLVYELDRVLDGKYVSFEPLVDGIEHGGEGRGLARAGFARDEDHALGLLAQVVHDLRHLQFLEGQRFGRYRPEDASEAIEVPHDVDAKARNARYFVGEIDGIVGLEISLHGAGHDLVQRFTHRLGCQRLLAELREGTVNAHARWIARDEVQVGGALDQRVFQVLIDLVQGDFVRFQSVSLPCRASAGSRCQ